MTNRQRPDPGFEIHELGPTWASALGEFFVDLATHEDGGFFHPFPLDAANATRIAHLKGRDRYLIAEHAGVIVAFGMLRGWDSGFDVPSLGIAVRWSARGSGLARAMMSALHETARVAGAKRVRLTVDGSNKRAVRLFRHFGYRFHDQKGSSAVGFLELT